MTKLGRWLLACFSSSEIKPAVLGDMEEIYSERLRGHGSVQTELWFWVQVLKSAPFLVGDSWRRKRDRRGNAPNAFCFFIRFAGMSVGLACYLTIIVITGWIQSDPRSSAVAMSPTAHHEALGEGPSDRPPVGLTRTFPHGLRPGIDAVGLSVLASKKQDGSLRRPDERRLIGHARRLFNLEFMIMAACGLLFINSFPARSSRRPAGARLRNTAFRSTAFVLLTFGLAFIFGTIVQPYFRFLVERRMIMYWLISFWLFLGGVFHLFPAIVLSVSVKKDRPIKPRRLAVLNLAFSFAFLLGTVLIFRQIDRLKDTQAARDHIRTSAMLPLGVDGGLESRLSR